MHQSSWGGIAWAKQLIFSQAWCGLFDVMCSPVIIFPVKAVFTIFLVFLFQLTSFPFRRCMLPGLLPRHYKIHQSFGVSQFCSIGTWAIQAKHLGTWNLSPMTGNTNSCVAVSTNCEIMIVGCWTRLNEQHQYKVRTRDSGWLMWWMNELSLGCIHGVDDLGIAVLLALLLTLVWLSNVCGISVPRWP